MNPDLQLFLQAWSGGADVSDAERQRLLHHLETDAAFRDECVEEIRLLGMIKAAQTSGPRWLDLHDALGLSPAATDEPAGDDLASRVLRLVKAEPPSRVKARWLQWRPLMAAAAGIVFGMLCTSVLFGYVMPKSSVLKTKLLPLADAEFESGSQMPARGIPARADVWSGDFSRVVVAENGITPKHGQRMLRVLRSDNELSPPNERSYVGEAAQVIDLRPLRAEFSGAELLVEVSGQFNAIPTAVGAKYEFNVKAAAFRGDIADAPRLWEDQEASVSRSSHSMLADSDVATWQRVAVPLVVPPDADFLVIECAVVLKAPPAEHGAVEFPGHYLDQVEVRLTEAHHAN